LCCIAGFIWYKSIQYQNEQQMLMELAAYLEFGPLGLENEEENEIGD
jgi:hypothetical protein